MSASNVASSNSSSLWQLLRGLASSSATSSAIASEDSTTFRVVGGTSATAATSDGASSNDTSPPFSIELLTVLLGLQQVPASAATPSTGDASTASPTTGSALDRLFRTIDSDSSGDISAAEFTSFVTSFGGTADAASQIFALLDSDGNGAVSLADLAAALPPPPPPPPFTDIAQDMLSAIDSDGGLSDRELTDLATSLGISSEETQAILQSLDSNIDNVLTASELAQQLQAMFQDFLAQQSGPGVTATSKSSANLSIVA